MDMTQILDLVRGCVRPIITLAFTAVVVVMILMGRAIPDLLQWTWAAIMAEWFTERAISKAFAAIVNSKGGGV